MLAMPAVGAAQGAPDYLEDSSRDDLAMPEFQTDSGLRPAYRDMLAASYLLGVPLAMTTAGIGVLMPVGVHYSRKNPAGGNRAFIGILGGLVLGGVVGGLLDRPEAGFEFTTGMFAGMLGGYFTWGSIDVAFFAERPRSELYSSRAQASPRAW